ncbi:MAG TPA: chemotaxis response regulator protein-glutamate methylesterase [Xanthobacteraceae bacterium]|nr:chemotaxis response regulator protein-glutamate methylesterase [Xanthobacteraceae bacterium]
MSSVLVTGHSAANHAAGAVKTTAKAVRVVVVDDAVVVRSLLARWIDAEPDMHVVASLPTGREVIAWFEKNDADVVLLDIEMPDIDGISALPVLLQKKRDLTVIMVSTFTRRSAEISLRALSLGAADYIPKPESTREVTVSVSFRRELLEKVRALGQRRRPSGRVPAPTLVPPVEPIPDLHSEPQPALRARRPDLAHAFVPDHGAIQLRPFAVTPPRALLIGSSTGGPQALTALIEKLPAAVDRAPLLITQHMPPTFTTVMAEHLSRVGGRGAHEAEDGEPVLAGGIYVAPGGRHMRVVRDGDAVRIAIGDDEPIHFCRPSVDALFSSAAAVWGAASLALVLTGMGTDGTRGATDIVASGGSVIAQDESTSVVWGMPRSVAQAGLCSAVLPLDQIAPKVLRVFAGDRT